MEHYPNNSHTKAEEEREIKQVVAAATPVSKEPSFGKLILSAFLPEDISGKSIKEYVAKDIIGEGLKDLAYNLITDTLHMRFYGTAATGGTSARSGGSYQDYYKRNTTNSSGAVCANRKETSSSDTLPDLAWVDDKNGRGRAKAETVLATMRQTIQTYGMVTVADLLDFSKRVPTQNDFNLGWTNLDNAGVVRNNDGSYSLSLPTPRQID